MALSLRALAHCLDGVIPALIATMSADGVPNISYLSHVTMLDDEHIGLSNQFFHKTADNLKDNPHATVWLLDSSTGQQYTLETRYLGAQLGGAHFDRLAAQIAASSTRVGLADVMRLRQVDVFKVAAIDAVPLSTAYEPAAARGVSLPALQQVVERMTGAPDIGAAIDAALAGLCGALGIHHSLILELDAEQRQLTTLGSHGYPPGGIGSELPLPDEGIIGVAVQRAQVVCINEVSRSTRLGDAVSDTDGDEHRTRRIPMPGLPDAMSQIAVPLMLRGTLLGALFAESRQRRAFTHDVEAAVCLVAGQVASLLALKEANPDDEGGAAMPAPQPLPGPPMEVLYYSFDDSIFIDNQYVIKGVAGRLLYHMLRQFETQRKVEFSNRELRLEPSLKLPEFKTNVETRLLLLRRRLEEKALPIRLVQLARGRIGLHCPRPIRLLLAQ